MSYKKLNIDPELRTLALFAFTIIPFFIYEAIFGEWVPFDPAVGISFNILMAGVEAVFLFVLLRMIRGFFNEDQKKAFPMGLLVLMFFAVSSLRKILPGDIAFYWGWECGLILLQGGVLAVVQKHLNDYWALEREQLADTIAPGPPAKH